MLLRDYIKKEYGAKAPLMAFAREQGITKQQLNHWLTSGYVVFDGVLYSPRREIRANKTREK